MVAGHPVDIDRRSRMDPAAHSHRGLGIGQRKNGGRNGHAESTFWSDARTAAPDRKPGTGCDAKESGRQRINDNNTRQGGTKRAAAAA
ncbi:hypothetical protein MHIB_31850 [Mycolicibacter hiberniae]|uniref:Uncharacterized protein n=1 Tax=Mycolicibacter hiberniae TaxID=29314 RepID=A0A7I7X7E4_9MYCO|nr:hypothetical protein MHIB_31850 [Mycolicibacter hiberniae]